MRGRLCMVLRNQRIACSYGLGKSCLDTDAFVHECTSLRTD
jgi:hypothetical protein